MALSQSSSGVHYSPAAGVTFQNVKLLNATTVAATTGNLTTINSTTVNGTTVNATTVNGTDVNTTDVHATNVYAGTVDGNLVKVNNALTMPGSVTQYQICNDTPFDGSVVPLPEQRFLSEKGIQTAKTTAPIALAMVWAGASATKNLGISLEKTATRTVFATFTWAGGSSNFVSDVLAASTVTCAVPIPAHFRPLTKQYIPVPIGFGNPVAPSNGIVTIDTTGLVDISYCGGGSPGTTYPGDGAGAVLNIPEFNGVWQADAL